MKGWVEEEGSGQRRRRMLRTVMKRWPLTPREIYIMGVISARAEALTMETASFLLSHPNTDDRPLPGRTGSREGRGPSATASRRRTDGDSDGGVGVFKPMGTSSILHEGVQLLQHAQAQRAGRAAAVQDTHQHKEFPPNGAQLCPHPSEMIRNI